MEYIDEATKQRNREIIIRQLLEAGKTGRVTCQCGRNLKVTMQVYKCYYCGIFFCEICAPEHFGGKREDNHLTGENAKTKEPTMHTKGKACTFDGGMLYAEDEQGNYNYIGDTTTMKKNRDIAIEDARRIVALWNMADRLNLSTEFIEDGGMDEMVDLLQRLNAHLISGGSVQPENGVHDTLRAILVKLGGS